MSERWIIAEIILLSLNISYKQCNRDQWLDSLFVLYHRMHSRSPHHRGCVTVNSLLNWKRSTRVAIMTAWSDKQAPVNREIILSHCLSFFCPLFVSSGNRRFRWRTILLWDCMNSPTQELFCSQLELQYLARICSWRLLSGTVTEWMKPYDDVTMEPRVQTSLNRC